VKLPGGSKNASEASPGQMFASSSQTISAANPTQMALMRHMEPQLFVKTSEPMFDTDIGRKIEAAFRPEIIQVGHVSISGSLITAIARGNPLCLLNPAILNISF
jgi:hypothetical protein